MQRLIESELIQSKPQVAELLASFRDNDRFGPPFRFFFLDKDRVDGSRSWLLQRSGPDLFGLEVVGLGLRVSGSRSRVEG